MATKIQTLLIDDLDDSEAEGTVRFGLDGAEYEIDLNAEHAQAPRDARRARYVRRRGGRGRGPTASPAVAARPVPAWTTPRSAGGPRRRASR